MSVGELNGLTVLITRPREQAENLAALVVEEGGSPLIFPTLEIVPAEPACGWETLSEKLISTNIAVFTSANAVVEILAKKLAQDSQCEIAAIGTTTQAAISKFGLHCNWLPIKDYRSEGLLELPVFQNVHNKKIIIFAGEGGRDYLQDTLKERGAEVEKISVYRRICPNSNPAILEQFLTRKSPKIVVSTSVESLTNLLKLSSEVGDILSIPLVVVSDRISNAAKEKGFNNIIVADNASNEAVAMAMRELLSN